MKRPHLYLPLVDEAGDLLRYAVVTLYTVDGKVYSGPLYRDRTGLKTYGNPHAISPALLDVYLDNPARVVVGVVFDQSKPEIFSEPYDVSFDGSEAVTTSSPLFVDGVPTRLALLCATDSATGYWRPLKIDHEHAGVAGTSVMVGRTSALYAQAGTFTGATVLGAQAGANSARSSLRYAGMLGAGADAPGRGCLALGVGSWAAESAPAPWNGGALAIGPRTAAQAEGVALGAGSDASVVTGSGAGLLGGQVSIGRNSAGSGPLSTSVGPAARAGKSGVALGAGAGSTANGQPGSIGLGAGAQYGLPGDADPTHFAVLLGARDPSVNPVFSWANPDGSQSESPWDEFDTVMGFTGKTVQLQRHLTWVINAVKLAVAGDATLGGRGGTLGFYGRPPVAKQTIGDDEPASGIPALDSLIYALRDLGLLAQRTEAMTLYRASDLAPASLTGDQVPRWAEHFGTDVAVSTGAALPSFLASDPGFNGHPSVVFSNGVYRRYARPLQELRGTKLLRQAKHFAVVARHDGAQFGHFEGLFNLSGTDAASLVFTSDVAGSGTWQLGNAIRYELDGLNQTANRVAVLPGPHVYRMTNAGLWPHARPVLGGPRDQDSARNWDNFSGAVAEVVGMDETWDEAHALSMSRGLMFRYGIGQDPNALSKPAHDFLVTQHNPAGGIWVFWNSDYSDNYLGRVYGRAVNVPKPVVFTPFCSIFIWFDFFLFRGALVGNWGNIGFSLDYEVEVSVWIHPDQDDDDFDVRVDVDVEFDERFETHIGRFDLNNNLTWSMGRYGCQVGHKVCRIRHRVTREVICLSGHASSRYADVEVRVYSTKPDGSLLLEGTSPLWGDGTFGVRVTHPGHKVARIYEVSTGNLLGTTEWQERALPRSTVYATDDPDVSTANQDLARTSDAAISALAFVEMDDSYRYRARHILSTLQLVCNDDGSLNETYSAALPAKTARPPGESPGRWGAVWTILAVLRYQQVSGDGQFLPLARRLGDWLGGQSISSTRDLAGAYFAFRDLAAATGSASYASVANVAKTLMLSRWLPTGRFPDTDVTDAESLWADLMGGLFLLAIGDRAKARQVVRQLRRYRVKNISLGAPHYSGPSGLIGYRPYAELGNTPNPSPPVVIDQAGSWVAALFKARYGEPIGDDVVSLQRWQATAITGPNASGLYGAQFLSYSGNATAAPYGLRARPSLHTAAWAYLSTKGGRGLLRTDPLPLPAPTGLVLTASYDPGSGRVLFRYSWTVDPALVVTAFEASPEASVNAGQTWSLVGPATLSGPIEPQRDALMGNNGFSGSWSVPVPDNRATIYRIRLRLRNALFGSWIASSSVPLPTLP